MSADSSAQQLHGGCKSTFTREHQPCLGVKKGRAYVCVFGLRHAGYFAEWGFLRDNGMNC